MNAIYFKQEEEDCFCMPEIPDGTNCVIHPMKADNNFVKVNEYSRGRFGCLVYYKAKNFVATSEVDETEMVRESKIQELEEAVNGVLDAARYHKRFQK